MIELHTVIGRRQLSKAENQLKHNVEFLQGQLENYIQEELDEVLLGCVLEVELIFRVISDKQLNFSDNIAPAKFFVLNNDISDLYIDFGVRTKDIICVIGIDKVSRIEYIMPLSLKAQHKATKVLTSFLKNNDPKHS